jgi:hypothetical protein
VGISHICGSYCAWALGILVGEVEGRTGSRCSFLRLMFFVAAVLPFALIVIGVGFRSCWLGVCLKNMRWYICMIASCVFAN